MCILVFVARFAKERRLRIWRDYVAPTANLDQKDKQFVAKVSHSQRLEMHSGHGQASDNTVISEPSSQAWKHFCFKASQWCVDCVCKGCVHPCVYCRGIRNHKNLS